MYDKERNYLEMDLAVAVGEPLEVEKLASDFDYFKIVIYIRTARKHTCW